MPRKFASVPLFPLTIRHYLDIVLNFSTSPEKDTAHLIEFETKTEPMAGVTKERIISY